MAAFWMWNLWPHFDTSIGCAWNWSSRFSNSLEANYSASTWRWWSGPWGGWGWPDSFSGSFSFRLLAGSLAWSRVQPTPGSILFRLRCVKVTNHFVNNFDFSSYLTLPLKNTLCLATVGWPSVPWSRPCWTRRRRIWRTWRSSHPDLFEFVQKSE